MDDVQELFRQIINSQSATRSEVLEELRGLKGEIVAVRQEIAEGETRLTKRIDRAFKELAELSEDAPTREEFDVLTARVGVLERTSSVS